MVAALCMLLSPVADAKALPNAVVTPAKLATLQLPDDVVGSVIGLPMQAVGSPFPKPVLAVTLRERNDCKALLFSDVDLWTGDFTGFRGVVQQDQPDSYQYVLTQLSATYPSSQAAAQVFRRTFNSGLENRCHVVLPDPFDDRSQWRIGEISLSGSGGSWSATQIQDGQDTMWRCSDELKLKSNVMYEDVECQYGNGTSLTRQIADMTASRFPA